MAQTGVARPGLGAMGGLEMTGLYLGGSWDVRRHDGLGRTRVYLYINDNSLSSGERARSRQYSEVLKLLDVPAPSYHRDEDLCGDAGRALRYACRLSSEQDTETVGRSLLGSMRAREFPDGRALSAESGVFAALIASEVRTHTRVVSAPALSLPHRCRIAECRLGGAHAAIAGGLRSSVSAVPICHTILNRKRADPVVHAARQFRPS